MVPILQILPGNIELKRSSSTYELGGTNKHEQRRVVLTSDT